MAGWDIAGAATARSSTTMEAAKAAPTRMVALSPESTAFKSDEGSRRGGDVN